VPHLTVEQWTGLCQLVIFPACWWAIRTGGKKIVSEIHDAVDTRADMIALKRDLEVKALLDAHEVKDENRHQEIRSLINGKMDQLLKVTALSEHAKGLLEGSSKND
jgi:hypothetical protein